MKVPLTSGAYQSRSVIASAQRCLNLYPEQLPQETGEPMPVAHFPTPGLSLLGYTPELPVRGVRQASNGKIYLVAGAGVYRVTPGAPWTFTLLGSIATGRRTPVSLADNTIDLVVVDGTPSGGWSVSLVDDTFTPIVDPYFYGADRVDYIDGFFVFNKPGTQLLYWSGAYALTFDQLDVAPKAGAPDPLVTIAVAKREIVLIGERTTEVFYNAGVIDPVTGFLLQQFTSVQGVFIDYGTAAKYSVATNDNTTFLLSRDRTGKGIVLMIAGYKGERISTFAIEEAIRKYPVIDDAIGFCYQIGGHIFYVLTFPAADHTWVYDLLTKQWHEWAFTDSNGNEHAHRIMCVYPCFGILVAGDRQYGNLYQLDSDTYTDWGFPIVRTRTFPHIVANGRRVFYREFLADFETGTGPATTDTNMVSLSWSDDRGHSFGNPVMQSAGGAGDYVTSLQWQRLGYTRDRVWKLSWSIDAPVALQGAWITTDVADAEQAAPAQQTAG